MEHLSRRSFFGAVAGTVAAFALPKASIASEHPLQSIQAIGTMVGFQDQAVSTHGNLVFFLKNKYTQKTLSEEQSMRFFMGQDDVDPSFALEIDKQPVLMESKRSLYEWKLETARRLLLQSKTHYMNDARIRPVRNSERPPHESEAVRRDFVFDDHTARFILQIRRNWIAKMTRRGGGNVIVASRTGFKNLRMMNTEKNRRYMKRSGMKVVLFDDGLIVPGPFALLGYKGQSKYDCGMAFSYAETGEGGFVAQPNVEQYWTRLI